MAFEFFAMNGVDWAVIETGLGGRLDATNILVDTRCCVITSIGQHQPHPKHIRLQQQMQLLLPIVCSFFCFSRCTYSSVAVSLSPYSLSLCVSLKSVSLQANTRGDSPGRRDVVALFLSLVLSLFALMHACTPLCLLFGSSSFICLPSSLFPIA